ncbi:MAG: DUF1549 and DUF1553 domain-containing protein [Candidatus Hydrogenedentes bacterium]|nr:DUF1549 and DUF1553 domain-containing protein [Candidatus Hydrogenedentota bacterium]
MLSARLQFGLISRVILYGVIPCISANAAGTDWESVYRERLAWWSLQPVAAPPPPSVNETSWPRNEVDHFILAALEAKGLQPAAEADPRTLARRLSFALTGLPPSLEDVERFASSTSPDAYGELVQSLIDSPHFGEHWARHWMDVVHYSDTHGYEWDTPAKNAWMYRDYLIRAFNADVSFKQLILEQIAGDLIEPRADAATGLNESIIGPMSMRLGERRHGDNADAEGVTQEAMANIIDTVSKGYLATTVACAQCHDHKLDAVSQRDYFGLAGIFMSSRWTVRCADTVDPNLAVLEELKGLKQGIRGEMTQHWLAADDFIAEKIASAPTSTPDTKAAPPVQPFPESLSAIWQRINFDAKDSGSIETAWTAFAAEFKSEREKRVADNAANLLSVADFTGETIPAGWQLDGSGMKHGLVRDGEIVVADEGGAAIAQVLPAGRWTHVWSSRLAGALRSPLFEQDPPPVLSVEYGGGQFAAQSLVVENALHSERMKFLDAPAQAWLTLTAGNFAALAGGSDPTPRRVYLELVTKSLNNYFPPRTAYGGVKDVDEKDGRSWFGVSRVVQHAAGAAPKDELGRFGALFSSTAPPTSKQELSARLAVAVMSAVEQWRDGACTREDVRLINEALAAKWLPNDALANPALALLVAQYRETEKRLQPDRVVGSVDDWNEGRDERVGVRGSYTEFGDAAPRGTIRFLGGPAPIAHEHASGRLEFAQSIASDQNPLTARVFVNRVWGHLFGEGLVRTVDDFGQLGEKPSHPELLDWLARRFMDEGWSAKKLVTHLVTSTAWRQTSVPDEAASAADPENRLWHHLPMRRLEAESIRDAMLAVSGRLDASLSGEPVNPYRVAEDATKRLYSGPIDGDGRRGLYLKMTLMEPPRFLALFNQPIPKVTTGRRDATNVPDQALALLNDPFVIEMARHWSERVMLDRAASPEQRVEGMFISAFARPPASKEVARLVTLAQHCATVRGADTAALLSCQPVWQDVAHAIFNLKEFIYVQ